MSRLLVATSTLVVGILVCVAIAGDEKGKTGGLPDGAGGLHGLNPGGGFAGGFPAGGAGRNPLGQGDFSGGEASRFGAWAATRIR